MLYILLNLIHVRYLFTHKITFNIFNYLIYIFGVYIDFTYVIHLIFVIITYYVINLLFTSFTNLTHLFNYLTSLDLSYLCIKLLGLLVNYRRKVG